VRLRKRERTKTMVTEHNRRPELASSPRRARKPVRCAASDRRPFLPSRSTYIRWIAATLVAPALLFAIQLANAVSANLPQPDYVVVAIFENHSFDEIVDPRWAPFIYRLATGGALFVNCNPVRCWSCARCRVAFYRHSRSTRSAFSPPVILSTTTFRNVPWRYSDLTTLLGTKQNRGRSAGYIGSDPTPREYASGACC